ncbi:glycosyltransferase [Longispora albida]|uniref:glycosyltransferase n=1 Tax=Longispora albida TaxID=203523 RepID=UPI0003700636|nr:glycosyltransferase family 2 protein [Longispora albida]
MTTVVLMAAMSTVIWLSNGYFFTMLTLGIRFMRQRGAKLGDQARLGYGQPHLGRDDDLFYYFLVPCLNEEKVIAATVTRLLGHPASHVVVIDDGSDDATGSQARVAGADEVTVLRRNLPDARQGKGEALNDGLAAVRRMVASGQQDPEKVVVCVMDADGHLSDGAVRHVSAALAEPEVGAVQLSVRIRNRDRYLTRIQDFYFWAIAAVTQFGRSATGTVSLGGNGQFTRLTALNMIGERPWSRCLTEDLDLTISMVIDGWRLTTTPHAAVAQQAVDRLPALVRQRTRWYQGHMACGKRLPEIWGSSRLSHRQATELSLYLLVPWVLDLPWSILWHFAMIGFVLHAPDYFVTGSGPLVFGLSVATWYAFSFGPAIAAAYMQKKRSPGTGWLQALLIGHSFIVMNYVFFVCVWRAFAALVAGKPSTWAKTARVFESGAAPASRIPAPARRAGGRHRRTEPARVHGSRQRGEA